MRCVYIACNNYRIAMGETGGLDVVITYPGLNTDNENCIRKNLLTLNAIYPRRFPEICISAAMCSTQELTDSTKDQISSR